MKEREKKANKQLNNENPFINNMSYLHVLTGRRDGYIRI